MEVITIYSDAVKRFLTAVNAVDEQRFNQIPFEGSWTPGQVAEHIVLALQGMPQMLENARPTSRPANEKCDTITRMFLNFDLKFKAAPGIVPSNQAKDKQQLINRLQQVNNAVLKAAQLHNLSQECTMVEVPTLGFLTRLEWLCLSARHIQRHTHQLTQMQ